MSLKPSSFHSTPPLSQGFQAHCLGSESCPCRLLVICAT